MAAVLREPAKEAAFSSLQDNEEPTVRRAVCNHRRHACVRQHLCESGKRQRTGQTASAMKNLLKHPISATAYTDLQETRLEKAFPAAPFIPIPATGQTGLCLPFLKALSAPAGAIRCIFGYLMILAIWDMPARHFSLTIRRLTETSMFGTAFMARLQM